MSTNNSESHLLFGRSTGMRTLHPFLYSRHLSRNLVANSGLE